MERAGGGGSAASLISKNLSASTYYTPADRTREPAGKKANLVCTGKDGREMPGKPGNCVRGGGGHVVGSP